MKKLKFSTQLIHGGIPIDVHTGALSTPIYQVSTYHQKDVDAQQTYDYSRSGNPTRHALEKIIAELEGGVGGFAFASGMAATASVLATFNAGDHIVMCEDVYGGTYRASTKLFNRHNLEVTFVDAADVNNFQQAIRDNTKAIFLESPSNPLLKITDLKAAVDIAKAHNLISIIDNTFMTPYLQRPIDIGIDIVIHSATKFIGGHSDVVAGLVVVRTPELSRKLYEVQNGFGAILGPQDSWLTLRGLKTLKLRMDYQQANAQKLAEWLLKQKQITNVYYPGLESHAGYNIHKLQADGAGAVLSFTTDKEQTVKSFMKNVKLAAVAVSLGGVETIVSYPVKMSHAAIPRSERERLGITDNLIRVSLGIEDVDDLISDFQQALA